jgi:hypothetical protein
MAAEEEDIRELARCKPLAGCDADTLVTAVREADLVFGLNTRTDCFSIFYGRDLVRRIADGAAARQLMVQAFSLDFLSEELDRLVSACILAKGSCDYRGKGTHPNKN